MLRSLVFVRRPGPFGEATADHSHLSAPLRRLEQEGAGVLPELHVELEPYLQHAASLDPRSLTRSEALAYWLNTYNAGALLLASRAQRMGVESVLGVPGGFRQNVITVDGEDLSLDDIEHGKLRRFGDPRIHGALVCGSASCPTLRSEPYDGQRLDYQLDDQLRHFLASGALETHEGRGIIHLSRVFLWFGGDFVRPHRMPTFLPARGAQILTALRPWIDPVTTQWIDEVDPVVEYQTYDWGLQCAVR